MLAAQLPRDRNQTGLRFEVLGDAENAGVWKVWKAKISKNVFLPVLTERIVWKLETDSNVTAE